MNRPRIASALCTGVAAVCRGGRRAEARLAEGKSGGNMTKNIGWLAIGGIFGLFGAAEAQTTPPSTATTAFDGTYTLVSSAPESYHVVHVDPYIKSVAQCGEVRPGPLIIERGQAQFSSPSRWGGQFAGTVGPQGELQMRLTAAAAWPEGVVPGNEINLSGRIDRDGTVRALARSRACAYDLVWQKAR